MGRSANREERWPILIPSPGRCRFLFRLGGATDRTDSVSVRQETGRIAANLRVVASSQGLSRERFPALGTL
jgi:hypothetical protein